MLLGTAKRKERKKYTLKINRYNLSVKFFFKKISSRAESCRKPNKENILRMNE